MLPNNRAGAIATGITTKSNSPATPTTIFDQLMYGIRNSHRKRQIDVVTLLRSALGSFALSPLHV
jgi:hypothetical protein